MTDYYCDLGNGTFADATGADHTGNELTGPAGVWNAVNAGVGNAPALVAGDTLYLKGTGDVSRLIVIDSGTDISGWAIGDEVVNGVLDGGSPGDDWTGTLVHPAYGANDVMVIWLDDGYNAGDVNIGDGVRNETKSEVTGVCTSVDSGGIVFPTLSGDTTSGYIRFCGVNASWAVDETYAVLDGDGIAMYGIQLLSGNTNNYLRFEHIHATNFASKGWLFYLSACLYNILYHCKATQCAADGFDLYRFSQGTAIRCIAHSNTLDGIGEGANGYDALYVGCHCYNNGGSGLGGTSSRLHFYGCLSHDNGDSYECDDGDYINCVSDNPQVHGIDVNAGTLQRLIGCRFTNSGDGGTGYGVDAAGNVVIHYHCYFGGNADGGINAAVAVNMGDKSTLTGSDTDHGYTASVTDDYNLDPDEATLFSTAIDLDA